MFIIAIYRHLSTKFKEL